MCCVQKVTLMHHGKRLSMRVWEHDPLSPTRLNPDSMICTSPHPTKWLVGQGTQVKLKLQLMQMGRIHLVACKWSSWSVFVLLRVYVLARLVFMVINALIVTYPQGL